MAAELLKGVGPFALPSYRQGFRMGMDDSRADMRVGGVERLGFEDDGGGVDRRTERAGAVETPLGIDDELGELDFADADGVEFLHVLGADAEVEAEVVGFQEDGLAG